MIRPTIAPHLSALGLFALAGCASTPPSFGEATRNNVAVQTVRHPDDPRPAGPVDGGVGGRAGAPVEALRDAGPNNR